MATVLCEACGHGPKAHPWAQCGAYVEPEHWPPDVRTASAALVQYRSMMVEPCEYCGVAAGAHGAGVLCLCGHPAELHTHARLITPKTRDVQTWNAAGQVRELLTGEPPYERLYCAQCSRAKWEDDPKYIIATPDMKGRCNGYETPQFAERCKPGIALGIHIFKVGGKQQKSKWRTDYDCPWPLPAQVKAWRDAIAKKTKDAADKALDAEIAASRNHVLLTGPVREKKKGRKAR
jgi:hypothetical protein